MWAGDGGSSVLRALDVGDGVANGLQRLRVLIGNRDVEGLFAGVDDLDHRQRVDVQIVHEALLELHIVLIDTSNVVDDIGELRTDFLGGGHDVVLSVGLDGVV
ncbi:hypothetical protein SDC9_102536 [bioreactor metagenome]|uniref:Uncharacterized protein n=1 Tax=bioreactor metagenome TaxID=1076179 RepID=A0A645ARQ1_9ZZZZ